MNPKEMVTIKTSMTFLDKRSCDWDVGHASHQGNQTADSLFYVLNVSGICLFSGFTSTHMAAVLLSCCMEVTQFRFSQ